MISLPAIRALNQLQMIQGRIDLALISDDDALCKWYLEEAQKNIQALAKLLREEMWK